MHKGAWSREAVFVHAAPPPPLPLPHHCIIMIPLVWAVNVSSCSENEGNPNKETNV